MNCYICTDTDDENHCELHRYQLQPLQDFMAELTGCSYYKTSNNPFMFIDADHLPAIIGFIAGARLCLALVKKNNYWKLTATDKPFFNYGDLI